MSLHIYQLGVPLVQENSLEVINCILNTSLRKIFNTEKQANGLTLSLTRTPIKILLFCRYQDWILIEQREKPKLEIFSGNSVLIPSKLQLFLIKMAIMHLYRITG